MTETTVQEQNDSTSFWSPWAVFFLGIPFAALNWWRMRKKGKAIFFLFMSFFVFLLTSWADYRGGITPTDHAVSSEIGLARLLITGAFSGLLAIIISIDIQRFKKEEKTPVSVKWQILFVFWAILALANIGSWMALDYGARNMGECRFPRLQDVVYQNEFEQRTGLATLVLGRNDFNCDWIWDIERGESDSDKSYHMVLVGDLKNNKDSSLWVFERVHYYEKVTTDIFSEIVHSDTQSDGSEYFVKVEDPNAQYSNVVCAKFEKFTVCNLAFGYQNLISELNLTFHGLSDEEINELIQLIVSTNSQRIHVYETK